MDSQPSRNNLYLSVAILNVGYLIYGTTFAWSSPVLMKLTLTDAEGSTVASMLSLGSVLGPFISGTILNHLGRKYTVGLAMLLEIGSYLMLTMSSGFIPLSVGRFLSGVSCGMAFSTFPMYVAEISEDCVRGLLNTLSQLSICSGSLLMYTVGSYASYAVLHYVMLGLCAAFFLLFPLLPHSPYALVMKNKISQAEKTLTWLRQNRPRSFIEKELQLIQNNVEESRGESGSVQELLATRGNRRALTICTTLLVLQQFSGVTVVLFYAGQIFQMTGSSLSSSASSIVMGVVMTLSASICPVAVKCFGYKKPLLVSAAGMAMGIGGLAMFFILKYNHFEVDSIGWLPLLSIVVYILFFNTGFANIPWALSGELFPANVKPVATTIIASTCGLVAFFTSKLFPDLMALMGIEFLFMACSFFCGISVVFVTLVVQDTSGLSFAEIQEILNGRKRKHVSVKQSVLSDVKYDTTHM
uniref:Major facilitator superfamily (MFS) profile domain-containing protein n=1 Tax=Graphocephala atropunctata TaxID=36148 RepID=A0A1B6KYQ3_9HEMI